MAEPSLKPSQRGPRPVKTQYGAFAAIQPTNLPIIEDHSFTRNYRATLFKRGRKTATGDYKVHAIVHRLAQKSVDEQSADSMNRSGYGRNTAMLINSNYRESYDLANRSSYI